MHISAICSHWHLRFFWWKPLGNFLCDFSEVGSGPKSWQSRLWRKKKENEMGKAKQVFYSPPPPPPADFQGSKLLFFFWGWLTSEVCKWQTKNPVPQNRTTSWNDISACTLYAAMLFLFSQQIHCRVCVILMSIVRIIIASRWNSD